MEWERGRRNSRWTDNDCSYVFAKFQTSLNPGATQNAYSRAILTSLTLYIFGFLYQLVLVYDALRLQNTIQVIGLCIFNVALLVYASLQMTQIQDAIDHLSHIPPGLINPTVWDGTKQYLTAVPCIIALGFVLMSVVAWKLYDEFAWMIYKHISADLRMKRRYLTFQVCFLILGISRGPAVLTVRSRFTSPFSSSTFSFFLGLPSNLS